MFYFYTFMFYILENECKNTLIIYLTTWYSYVYVYEFFKKYLLARVRCRAVYADIILYI